MPKPMPRAHHSTPSPPAAAIALPARDAGHNRAIPPSGERGCISLWGRSKTRHELFAEHVAGSETWVETHGYARTVHEWSQKPSRPDNPCPPTCPV